MVVLIRPENPKDHNFNNYIIWAYTESKVLWVSDFSPYANGKFKFLLCKNNGKVLKKYVGFQDDKNFPFEFKQQKKG